MSSPARFVFESTADGSPTVRIYSGDPETGVSSSESMHSPKGAFSETEYIYGTAVDTLLTRGFEPRVLSMGLGLGYVELLAAARFLNSPLRQQGGGESFELLPELRAWFSSWLHGARGHVPDDFAAAYDVILELTSRASRHTGEAIRTQLITMLGDGRWLIREALAPDTRFHGTFGCICFDAFSSKSTPEVWSEEFLGAFLDKATAPGCVLSTYACTGKLKRTLRSRGFELDIREGFASKRDSTFAVRLDPRSHENAKSR